MKIMYNSYLTFMQYQTLSRKIISKLKIHKNEHKLPNKKLFTPILRQLQFSVKIQGKL